MPSDIRVPRSDKAITVTLIVDGITEEFFIDKRVISYDIFDYYKKQNLLIGETVKILGRAMVERLDEEKLLAKK